MRTSEDVLHATWGQGLLTLVSILLGAALAVAAQQIAEIIGHSGIAAISAPMYVRIAVLFLAVSGTFYYYYNQATFVFYRVSIVWIMFPMLVGMGIIAAAYSIQHREAFLVSMVWVYAAGALSFVWTMVEHARRANSSGLPTASAGTASEIGAELRFENVKNVVLFVAQGLVTTTLLLKPSLVPIDVEWVFLAVNGALYIGMLVITERRYLHSLYATFDHGTTSAPPAVTHAVRPQPVVDEVVSRFSVVR